MTTDTHESDTVVGLFRQHWAAQIVGFPLCRKVALVIKKAKQEEVMSTKRSKEWTDIVFKSAVSQSKFLF